MELTRRTTLVKKSEIRNQSNDATADLVKEAIKLYRDPQDGEFVDENQTAQGAFTLEGKAGSTQEFTADFFAGDPSKLPDGWTINSQGQLTGTATI